MKNITQYFEDTVKSIDGTPTSSANGTKDDIELKETPKGKRNRVKIKISRINEQQTVCNILESSSDLVDKTPSPFTKTSKVDDHLSETYKKSLTNVISAENEGQNQKVGINNYLTRNEKSKDNGNRNVNNDGEVIPNAICNDKHEEEPILVDLTSNDEIQSNKNESNAFQILMCRNKVAQSDSPTNILSQNEENDDKKSEELKEKLKHSKEKLIALAEKKGYTKRKLAELQESEKMERIIQDRIKLFKGDGKKSNSMDTTVLNLNHPSGSLLNYFSKVPADLAHNNIPTIVVKADVHVPEVPVKSNSISKIRSIRKNKKCDIELSHVDDIIIDYENVNSSSNKNKQQAKQNQNNHKWPLKIKVQPTERTEESTDEELNKLYSPRSKNKLAIQGSKKSMEANTRDSKSVSTRSKIKEEMSKQTNSYIKLKSDNPKHMKSTKIDTTVMPHRSSERKLERKLELNKMHEQKTILERSKKLESTNGTNSGNVKHKATVEEDCKILTDNTSKKRPSDKLAPLFTKRKKPDPKTLAAQRQFLQPDIPYRENKNTIKKVTVCNTLPFPLISHVTQLNSADCSKTEVDVNLPTKSDDIYKPLLNVSNFKKLIKTAEPNIRTVPKFNKPKVEEALTDIEKHCPNAKQIWDIISLTIKEQSKKPVSSKSKARKSKQLEEKGTVLEKSKVDQFINHSWTYKYRPKRTAEIVGNEEAATKLREWLMGWRATFTSENVSSEDEFYSSDSFQSRIIENNQTAVLLGPHGCGKTASVYAVAEEFGYTVLEINASSRRTGKKMLKELEEATKSHRVNKNEISAVFGTSCSHQIVPKKTAQDSLILLEDVDIVFEEDEGFVSAAYQLASNTKRPIVMTCRDVCSHLNRMAPQQNRIYFQNAIGSRVFALLELISLAETGYRLPTRCLMELLQSGDLRKSILQLQYLLLSGPMRALDQSVNFKNSFWQNMRYSVYKSEMKKNKRRKKEKASSNETSKNDRNTIISIANKLDNIAFMSTLIDIQDSALDMKHVRTQPNLSLIENAASYSASNNVSRKIAEWIGNKVVNQDMLNEHDGMQLQSNIMLKKQLNDGINLTLSHLASQTYDRHIISTDYLPALRTICRAEESRANRNNKRGNRFFHYLHNLKAATLLKPNVLTAACKVMCESKDSNSTRTNDSNIRHKQ